MRDRLLTNTRAAAGLMRDIVWGIDSQADTTGALLDRMRDYLDQTAGAVGLRTHLEVAGLSDESPLAPELESTKKRGAVASAVVDWGMRSLQRYGSDRPPAAGIIRLPPVF